MLSSFPLRSLAVASSLALLIVLAVVAPGASTAGGYDQAVILEEVEKKQLEYPNLGFRLDQLVARVKDGQISGGQAAGEAAIHSEESVAVTIHLTGNADDVVEFLVNNGGDPRYMGEEYIEAYVPVTLLGSLSEQPGILRVREIIPPEPAHGPVTSQGVQAHAAAAWHQAGPTGKGVKVGIIDVGFEGFTDLTGTELPAPVAARCYTDIGVFTSNPADCENEGVHGTAVAESLIDIAPEVSLYIANPISMADLQSAADWMILEGVTVINSSVVWIFDGPGDGTSPFSLSPLNTVDRAVEGGVIWVNGAGNAAQKTWFSDSPIFYPSSTSDIGFIAFDGDADNSNSLRGAGIAVVVQLRWDDRWSGASSDLDLLLWDTVAQRFVARSQNFQSGSSFHIPFEALRHRLVDGRKYSIVVTHLSGGVPDWVQANVFAGNIRNGTIEHYTGEGSISSPAESANLGMLAVGAAHYWDIHTIADYSSRGPTPDGRVKPDIVGADCGQAASYEPLVLDRTQCWFPGTSQASSHVAGMAALVRQRYPDYSPARVAEYLKDEAVLRRDVPNNTWGHGFAYLPSSNREVSPDRDALVALYRATGGDNWTNRANWLNQEAPIGLWYGVTTDINGRVTRLDLRQNQLTGEIPPDLGSLTNLETLYLAINSLTGEIPAELGSLSNLVSLNLRRNQLSGAIPAELGSLLNLRNLELPYNSLSGEIPAELGSLSNLRTAYLHDNQLTGEIPSDLGNLPNLDRLELARNRLGGAIPGELGNLHSLTYLSLSGNQLRGKIPAELGNLPILWGLVLSGNQLSGEIPGELGNLAELEWLLLSDNQLTGEIPVELGNLAFLEWLSLSDNQLTGEIPVELGSLLILRDLVLSDNQLSGEIPGELGNLAELEWLLLDDNQLTGEIPLELGNLDRLRTVALQGNQLTGCVPPGLRDVPDNDFDALGLPFCQGTAPPADPCLEKLYGDGTTIGQWTNGCDSTVSKRGHALYYGFTLEQESEVTITLESQDADTFLYLRQGADAKSGAALYENDDHEGSTNVSQIQATLAAGSYTIEATTYGTGESGSFTLTVTGLGGSGAPPEPSADPCYRGPLPGDGVYADQWAAGCDSAVSKRGHALYYGFTLEQESEVTITLESQDADTFLYLRQGADAKSGAALYENDDHEGSTSVSQIQETLAAGSYTIEATTYTAGQTGGFTLTVSGLGGGAGPGPSPGCGYTAPYDSQTVGYEFPNVSWDVGCHSQVSGRGYAWYLTFTLGQESEVTITLESDDADTYLYLRQGEARSGPFLHENDDHEGSAAKSQIQETLAAGSYTIEATTYTAGQTGGFTLTVTGLGSSGAPPQEIVFAEPNWHSAQLQTHIARYMLEKGYVYSTKSRFGSTDNLITGLALGDMHVLMEVWLPNQSELWDPALEAGEILDLGTSLGHDWQSAFVIPAYLQQQHPELDSVEDLKEQRFKNLFQTAETGGKARLVSCVTGWNCESDNAAQVTGYGLDEHVHIVNPGSADALFGSINDHYQRREPWLGYMWGTGDPALLLDLVRLEEPPYSDECWDSTRACAYEDATILIGAHSSLPEQAPEVVEFLRKWDFAVDSHLRNVTRWQEANPDASIQEAALHWLRNNADTWNGWVTGDAAARILSALPES